MQSKLKIGDKIRINAVPGENIPGYCIDPDTVNVYKMLIKRKRPVRINKIDASGTPWFSCRFKVDGVWEYHDLSVLDGEYVTENTVESKN